jgi:hypothetical protein
MLHFFRRIRRDLLANSQFFKYLRYAIGEIILVVLGILIALQINNWNVEKENREEFDNILVEIENELIKNIQVTKNSLEYLHPFDSIYAIILFDDMSRENFKNDSLFLFRDTPWLTNEIQIDAFNKLATVGKGKTSEQDSIYHHLKTMYNSDWISFLKEQIKTSKELSQEIAKSRKKFSWYKNSLLNQIYNDEELNYYLNDPTYKKEIAQFSRETCLGLKQNLGSWEIDLLENYQRIFEYLEKKNIPHSYSLMFGYEPVDFFHYAGNYKFERSTQYLTDWSKKKFMSTILKIEIEDDKIFISSTDYEGNLLAPPSEIIPISKSNFRYRGLSFNILFNENNLVSGINLWTGISRITYEKIE